MTLFVHILVFISLDIPHNGTNIQSEEYLNKAYLNAEIINASLAEDITENDISFNNCFQKKDFTFQYYPLNQNINISSKINRTPNNDRLIPQLIDVPPPCIS